MSHPPLREVHIHEPVDAYDDEWRLICAGVIYEHGCDLLSGNGRIHGTRGIQIIHITMPVGMTDADADSLAAKVTTECERVLVTRRKMLGAAAIGQFRRWESELSAAHRTVEAAKSVLDTTKAGVDLAETAQRAAGAAGSVITVIEGLRHFFS